MHRTIRQLGVSGLVLLAIAALLVSVWANVWKQDLVVQKLTVHGTRYVLREDIIAAASIPAKERLFDVDLFAVQRRVMGDTFLKSVSVRREVPDGIVITVEERVPIAAVMLRGVIYLDAEGFVLPPPRSREVIDVPVLTGSVESSDLQPGTYITRPSLVEALSVVRLARTIDERLYRLISEVQMSGKRGLVFYTAEAGVPVIIGRENIGVRLVNFDGFWRQFVDPRGAGELQYVDLRFEDQVVVKWKNTGVDDQPTDQQGAVQM